MPPKPSRLAVPKVPKVTRPATKKTMRALMAAAPPPSTIVNSGSTFHGETFERRKRAKGERLQAVREDTTSEIVNRHKPRLVPSGGAILPWALAAAGVLGVVGLGFALQHMRKRAVAAENESSPEVIAARVAHETQRIKKEMEGRFSAQIAAKEHRKLPEEDLDTVRSGASEHKEGESDEEGGEPTLDEVDALADTLGRSA